MKAAAGYNRSTVLITLKIFVLLLLLEKVHFGLSQTFIRDCNNPLITIHTARFGHSYCYHACGFSSNAAAAVCSPAGYCVCPCLPGGPNGNFDPGVCPPDRVDPADTDATALPNCMTTCAGLCQGGMGMICGEVYQGAIQGSTNSYAKICVCLCPPPCLPATTTTSSTTTTTTTTTVAPTTAGNTQVSIILKPPIKPLKKIKLIAIKWTLLALIAFIGSILKLLVAEFSFIGFGIVTFLVISYVQSVIQNIIYDYLLALVRAVQLLLRAIIIRQPLLALE